MASPYRHDHLAHDDDHHHYHEHRTAVLSDTLCLPTTEPDRENLSIA